MYLYVLLVFTIIHWNVIYGQGISVLFNNTLTLDNSTITWNSFSVLQCTVSTTDVTTTQVQTSTSTIIESVIVYSCLDGSFGLNCNITSDICIVSNPCLNKGRCLSNKNLTLGYSCQCISGFSGDQCAYDDRICADETCWNNGTCIEMNTTISGNDITSFTCQCVHGYDGTQCELQSDMCANITCENNGICISSFLNWSCSCLDASLYSGIYCQDKSSTLATKQALSKSLGIIAIVAISSVFAFVVFMDVLKYVFKVDPVDRERYRLRMEKEKKEQKKIPKRKTKKSQEILVPHFSII